MRTYSCIGVGAGSVVLRLSSVTIQNSHVDTRVLMYIEGSRGVLGVQYPNPNYEPFLQANSKKRHIGKQKYYVNF